MNEKCEDGTHVSVASLDPSRDSMNALVACSRSGCGATLCIQCGCREQREGFDFCDVCDEQMAIEAEMELASLIEDELVRLPRASNRIIARRLDVDLSAVQVVREQMSSTPKMF